MTTKLLLPSKALLVLAGLVAFTGLSGCSAIRKAVSGERPPKSTTAPHEVTLDLIGGTREFLVPVAPESITVTIVNRLPAYTYSVATSIRTRDIVPHVPQAPSGFVPTGEGVCAIPLATLETAVYGLTREQDLVRTFSQALSASPAPCVRPIAALKDGLTSQVVLSNLQLRPGDEMVMTVSRAGTDGPASWEFTLHTPPRGRLNVVLGYTFAHNTFNHDRAYAAMAASDTTGGFIIRRTEESPRLYASMPSVLLSWTPHWMRHWYAAPSVTGGISLDPTNFALFTGLAATVVENLTFTGGVTVFPARQLREQYTGSTSAWDSDSIPVACSGEIRALLPPRNSRSVCARPSRARRET
jgi:hypothetical protein